MVKRISFKAILFTIASMLYFGFLQSETVAQRPSNYNEPDAGRHFNPFLISNLANLRWLSETSSYCSLEIIISDY